MTRFFLFAFTSVLVLASSGFGQQTTAQINGTVIDSQGAAVVNADIAVTELGTGLTRTTVSSAAGL